MKAYEFLTDELAEPLSLELEDIVKEIKTSAQNPANIQPASGLLADHLATSPEIPDPSFDVVE